MTRKTLTIDQARARAEMPTTHAISIDAPWAWSIAHADKRVENRSWKPGAEHEGRRIAIAATARAVRDEDRAELLDLVGKDFVVPETDEIETGAIIATARIVGLGHVDKGGHIVITGRMLDVDMDRVLALAEKRRGAWCEPDAGGFWVLDDVRTLDHPIACKGMQRLWKLTPAVVAKLRAASWKPGA